MRVAEFFAGIGLVGKALQNDGFEIVFANDICPIKERIYRANFDGRRFARQDIRRLTGSGLPTVDLATASFPCTDLSLAGRRKGLAGKQSGLFWEFVRLLDELEERKPAVLLIENVPSWTSADGGRDFVRSIQALNRLGYSCDPMLINAAHFVPQSRLRLFMTACQQPLRPTHCWSADSLRPQSIFSRSSGSLQLHSTTLPTLAPRQQSLGDIVEHFLPDHDIWWDEGRLDRFLTTLSPLHTSRLETMRGRSETAWATAYRRTRNHRAVWEIRSDGLAGCLRTSRGGSSRQALVEAGAGQVRVRWMTASEYGALQGASDLDLGSVSDSQARFGLGDAVCVPVVSWLGLHYLKPLLQGLLTAESNSQRLSHPKALATHTL